MPSAGTEAMRWIVTHAFEQLNMHRVTLSVVEDNPRAISLYQKMSARPLSSYHLYSSLHRGFVEEGRTRQGNFQDGRWWDVIQMGIMRGELK
jgi:RimJ/RimL family protein N-acetyltransferase